MKKLILTVLMMCFTDGAFSAHTGLSSSSGSDTGSVKKQLQYKWDLPCALWDLPCALEEEFYFGLILFADRDTLIVSPMPSFNNMPIPIADLMLPVVNPPASVMPICKG